MINNVERIDIFFLVFLLITIHKSCMRKMRSSSVLKDSCETYLLSFQIFEKLFIETLIRTVRRLSLQGESFNSLSIYRLSGRHYAFNLWLRISIILLEIIKYHLINIYQALVCLAFLIIQMKNVWLLILFYLSECPLPQHIALSGIPLIHIVRGRVESSRVLLSR